MGGPFQFSLDLFGPADDEVAAPVADPVPPRRPVSPAPTRAAAPAPAPAPGTASSVSPLLRPSAGTPIIRFHHPQANALARIEGVEVGYALRRGKRRTIGFSVGPEGLVVSAPRWVGAGDVQAAVTEKAGWILRKLRETRERHEKLVSSRIDWRDGAVLPFLGEPMRVALSPTHPFAETSAVLRDLPAPAPGEARHQLLLALPQQAGAEQIRDAVQAWMMRQARRLFTERLNHFAPLLRVSWRKLSLSSAGTRWGSARSDGSIRLHWRLVHFRIAVIDYVVAHELSHLRVMDHSPRFWDTVATVVPDYADLRGQLKEELIPQWQ